MTLSPDLARPTAGWAAAFAESPNALPVEIHLCGIRYPGEAVFIETWDPRWGGPPGVDAMFRVVFLASPGPVSPGEIDDDRVVVVAPSGGTSSELRPVAEEAAALRETRAVYAVSGDPGLSRLTRAIEVREGELASIAADSMGRSWADGTVIARGKGPDLTALLPALERAGPDAWIEALGRWLIERDAECELPRSAEPLTAELTADIFDLVAGRSRGPSGEPDPLARTVAASLGLGGATSDMSSRFESGLDGLLEADGTATGTAVRSLVTTSLRLPPELGALYLVDYVRRRGAEAVLSPVAGDGVSEGAGPRLNRDTLPDTPWEPRLLQRLYEVRSVVPDDWDSALPYLTIIYPPAVSVASADDQPPPEEVPEEEFQAEELQVSEFTEALRSCESRVSLTAMIVARLERALGVQSGWKLDRLAGVLSAESWPELVTLAREAFGSARDFRVALAREHEARALATHTREIERAVAFLDFAEFGGEHRPLKLEQRTLRARFSAGLLDDVTGVWPALRSDFDRWRTEYRRAYRWMHANRRALDEELQRKMARSIVQLAAVEGFAQLPELGPPQDSDLTQRFEELAVSLEPCPTLEHDVPLVDQPYCETCGVTLSSPAERQDIDAYLFELESVLRSYNRRLSSVAVREALAGKQPERLSRLLRLRDASDLSALSDHLGSDVIDFLREFLASSDSQD